jgi:anti-sigma regulatory factor (Ser/Thr protein kinase)
MRRERVVHWLVDAISLNLPAAPSAATTARSEITRRLSERITRGLLEDVRLLLTELITNALRHADMAPDDEIAVRAELSGGTVRIEVRDPGRDGLVELRPPGPRGGGYGLFLVERLTDQWGVELRDGTTVWAELSAGPAR